MHFVRMCKTYRAVVSFGANKISCELICKAMLQSPHLSHKEGTNKLCGPKEWLVWFDIKDPIELLILLGL